MPSLAQVDRHAEAATSTHSMLRRATRAHHEALDETLSRFDLADAPSYQRFLQVHLRALVVLIALCSEDDRQEFAPLLALLEADLGLKCSSPAPGIDLPAGNATTALGVAYVLRGSRLGAVHLRRRVGPTLPMGYLCHDVHTSWGAFLARLDAVPRSAGAANEVVDAARMAFGVFDRAARREARFLLL